MRLGMCVASRDSTSAQIGKFRARSGQVSRCSCPIASPRLFIRDHVRFRPNFSDSFRTRNLGILYAFLNVSLSMQVCGGSSRNAEND